jgi:hypothetical protein
MHPVVSAVLIIAFSTAIVGMVVSFGTPLLESKKQALDFESGRTVINRISETVADLADDPVASSKYTDVNFASGYIEFNQDTVSFYMDSLSANQTFEGVKFNKFDLYSGRSRIKLTKLSVNEIQVGME